MNQQPFQVCPRCHQSSAINAQVCRYCRYQFQSQFSQPSATQTVPPFGSATGFAAGNYGGTYSGAYPTADPLTDLARRHKESNTTFTWTLIVGIFFWPLWILTFMEYTKMRDLKSEVARMGVDVWWWERTYPTK